jgi:SAM-dependent methyltransferase
LANSAARHPAYNLAYEVREAVTSALSAQVDWAAWLRRWDAQQTFYLPMREERFEVMFDALEATVGSETNGAFVALDLACGPGSISQRLLARFPTAHAFAVDLDPLLLAIGQGALGTSDGRITWLDDDLNDPAWADRLAERLAGRQLDAVLSSTALHWITPGALARVYRALGQLMRPGGVFLNADHMQFGPQRPTIRALTAEIKTRRRTALRAATAVEDWEQWWQAIRAEPRLAELLAERERRMAWRDGKWTNAGLDFQIGALVDAGFREVDVIWQWLDNRVLMAVR